MMILIDEREAKMIERSKAMVLEALHALHEESCEPDHQSCRDSSDPDSCPWYKRLWEATGGDDGDVRS